MKVPSKPKTPVKKTTSSSKTSSSKKSSKSTDKPSTIKVTPLKFNATGKTLVIVESPGKVKTIGKYLGSEYVIKPSVWHIVDLVDKNMGKLVAKDFEPDYEVDPAKKKVVSELRTAAKASKRVILATDEDREGEAISYHLCTVLGLDPSTTPRIVFNEITKTALEKALDHPRTIDVNLVNAQKTRAVLDKLVWFSISPILRSKIKTGLSAGRVQSVAVKLIVEKEREIQAFVPKEFYTLKAILDTDQWLVEITLKKFHTSVDTQETTDTSDDFVDEEDNSSVKEEKTLWKFSKHTLNLLLKQLWVAKPTITKDEKTGYEIRTFSDPLTFRLSEITSKQSKKSPPPPFITSTLQQTASRLFGRPVKSVMSAAQKLYEAGLITYMRTDSTTLSGTCIAQCKDFVTHQFGEQYSTVRQFKGKSKNAQEAHEAIRPTNIDITPEAIKLGQYEARLYKLIWQRTLASQMADALFTNTQYVFYPVV